MTRLQRDQPSSRGKQRFSGLRPLCLARQRGEHSFLKSLGAGRDYLERGYALGGEASLSRKVQTTERRGSQKQPAFVRYSLSSAALVFPAGVLVGRSVAVVGVPLIPAFGLGVGTGIEREGSSEGMPGAALGNCDEDREWRNSSTACFREIASYKGSRFISSALARLGTPNLFK